MFSRSRIRNKRGAAYGRGLYKINNDTSMKLIERIVVLVIVIIVIVVWCKVGVFYHVRKVISSHFFRYTYIYVYIHTHIHIHIYTYLFFFVRNSVLVHEDKARVTSMRDLNVSRDCWTIRTVSPFSRVGVCNSRRESP